jgi:hypothetical protein
MAGFLLTSTIAMAALLAVYYLLLQSEKMHRFNRFYLLVAVVFALAVPFITIPVYKEAPAPKPQPVATAKPQVVQPQELPQAFAPHVAQQLPQPAAPAQKIDYRPVLWSLYGLGVLFFALRFMLNIRGLYRLAMRSQRVRINGAVLVLLNNCPMPYTFMRYIFVCKKEYEGKTISHELLAHETTHVRQHHTLDILFIEAVKTALWFNPFVYAFKNAMQLNHEFLADEKTLNQFNNIPTYQQMLLDRATPHSYHLLASSINFSVTKKRFVMMTKTTSRTKGIVLKTAMVPVAAALLYFLSTETVLYAKNPGTATPAILSKQTAVGILPQLPDTPGEATITNPKAPADSLVGDTRRDEYFKGVRIVIDDELRSVHINTPYEKLALEHKRFYLNDVPEKKVIKTVSKEDFDFTLNHNPENSVYYIDEKKVPREEVLKYKREDFVSMGFKMQGKSGPDGKMTEQFQMFIFTRPFYEKNMLHLHDRYPDKTYTIKVTGTPIDTTTDGIAEANTRDTSGKTAYEREEEANAEKLKADRYDYVSELAERNKNISPQFPGGSDEFEAYVNGRLKLPDAYKGKTIRVLYSVNTDGTLSEVSCPGVDDAIEKEIVALFEASPRWIPAQKNGKAIKISSSFKFNTK